MEKFFTVICCYNNEKLLNDMLVSSLNLQSFTDFETVFVDAKEKGFTSASQSLNYACSQSNGKYLIIAHQDVSFEQNFLSDLKEFCISNEFGVAGIAGVKDDSKDVLTNLVCDKDYKPGGQPISEITSVSSIDECLFVIKKDGFKSFDDYGDVWHFYGVEYSYRCRENGEKVLVFPFNLYHLSPGWSLNKSYWDTLKIVAKRFKEFKVIATTMGRFKNNAFLSINIKIRRLKSAIKRKFIKR